ncbi:MAG: extracellular solute-binding protein, partial [Spiroplasma sp.]
QNGNTFTDYVNAHSNQEIDDVAEWLKPIIRSSYTKIQSDEIVDTVAVPKNWDIAFMYNGDLLGAMTQDFVNTKYTIVRPYMGLNIWNDNMVISKKTRNKDLAYKFINYIMQHDVQVELSKEFGYTSPVQSAIDEVSKLNPETNWSNVYIPGATQIAPVDNPSKPIGYYNGLYRTGFDPYMQDQYNKLLVRQGKSNNVTVLLIQLGIVSIIIIIFVVAMLWFR